MPSHCVLEACSRPHRKPLKKIHCEWLLPKRPGRPFPEELPVDKWRAYSIKHLPKTSQDCSSPAFPEALRHGKPSPRTPHDGLYSKMILTDTPLLEATVGVPNDPQKCNQSKVQIKKVFSKVTVLPDPCFHFCSRFY